MGDNRVLSIGKRTFHYFFKFLRLHLFGGILLMPLHTYDTFTIECKPTGFCSEYVFPSILQFLLVLIRFRSFFDNTNVALL